MKEKQAFKDRVAGTVEAPVYPDQREVELKALATLATVINSDVADLRYSLCELAVTDFHFKDHRAIFAAMKKMADAGDHVDQITVKAEVGDAWPDTLKDVFDPSNANAIAIETYKKKLLFWSNINDARQIGQQFLTAVENAREADLPGLIADLQKTVFDIGKTDRLLPPIRSEADLIDDFMLDMAQPQRGYRTGFDKLEEIIKSLTPGLFVIAAPPSAGKTTYVKQLADEVAALNEAPVLFFSYEQSAAELRIKSLARLSKFHGRKVTNEEIKEGKHAGRLDDAVSEYKRLGKWITIIEADHQHTPSRIRLMAQREKMKAGKAPVIIVDYLQIMPAADPSLRDKRGEVDFLISELRRIARDIDAPIIVISAMSRAEYDRARMSGFKESGGIEYGADIAAVLNVDEERDGTERTVTLNIVKNRNGRRGKISMTYDLEHDHFEETAWQTLSYTETLGKDGG